MDSKVESLPTEIHLPERSSTVVAKTYEVSITSQVPHSPDHARHLSSSSRGYPDRPRSPPQERFSSINETAFQTGRPVNIIVPEPEPEPVVTVDANKATISYCKTAMLFFVALFCTWCVFHHPARRRPQLIKHFQGSFDRQSCLHLCESRHCPVRTRLGLRPCSSAPRLLEYHGLHRHELARLSSLVAGPADLFPLRLSVKRPSPPAEAERSRRRLDRHQSRHRREFEEEGEQSGTSLSSLPLS